MSPVEYWRLRQTQESAAVRNGPAAFDSSAVGIRRFVPVMFHTRTPLELRAIEHRTLHSSRAPAAPWLGRHRFL